MTIENVAKALDILLRNGFTGYAIAAEHDMLYLGPDSANVIPRESPDGRQLSALGCDIDTDTNTWVCYV